MYKYIIILILRIFIIHTAAPFLQNERNSFGLQRGQWTDDAAMGLCLSDSLIYNNGQLNGSDLRSRFHTWWHHGYCNAFRNEVPGGMDYYMHFIYLLLTLSYCHTYCNKVNDLYFL